MGYSPPMAALCNPKIHITFPCKYHLLSHIFTISLSLSLSIAEDKSNHQLESWVGYDGLDIEDHSIFSEFPHCPLDYPVINTDPLMINHQETQLPPLPDFLQDSSFSGDVTELWDSMIGSEGEREKKEAVVERSSSSKDGEKGMLTFEEVSRYFYMPITQAAKELNIGVTILKKRCRELGIPRWPHRKMKSLQNLINNVQELGREEGAAGEAQLSAEIENLEQEKMLMEKDPRTQLDVKTKRLRQSCFKANYMKRRIMAGRRPRIGCVKEI